MLSKLFGGGQLPSKLIELGLAVVADLGDWAPLVHRSFVRAMKPVRGAIMRALADFAVDALEIIHGIESLLVGGGRAGS